MFLSMNLHFFQLLKEYQLLASTIQSISSVADLNMSGINNLPSVGSKTKPQKRRFDEIEDQVEEDSSDSSTFLSPRSSSETSDDDSIGLLDSMSDEHAYKTNPFDKSCVGLHEFDEVHDINFIWDEADDTFVC